MQSYYSQQAQLPHFGNYRRQRGSGFGALIAGAGGLALPLIKRYAIPTAKKLGKEFLQEGLPELIDVVSKRKSPKQALRSAVKKTVKRQVGGGYRRRLKHKSTNKKKGGRVRRQFISRSKKLKRSRADFFSRVKNA